MTGWRGVGDRPQAVPRRRSFMVHVYAGGPVRVEDVRSGQAALVEDLDDLGRQVRKLLGDEGGEDPGSD